MSKICHYTTSIKAIKIITTGFFKFGKLENSNDPFENLIKRYNISYNVPDYLNQFMMRLFDHSNKELSFASFGQDTDINHTGLSWTMWAHYGNKHSGVCLVFDKSALINEISIQTDKFEARNVNYTNSLLINPIYFNDKINDSYISILKEFKEILLFSKHQGWKSEGEFRIVVFENSFTFPISNCLKEVIYGPEIPYRNELRLNKQLKKMEFKGPYGKLAYAQGSYAKPSIFFFSELRQSNKSK